MLTEIKALVARSSGTLLEDAAGVAALAVMLLGVLHLPGML